MAWTGSITASSGVNANATFTPDTAAEGAYSVSSFTAPKKGVYRFDLKGSGGVTSSSSGGAKGGEGGLTVGYKIMEKNETVYVGAGGPRCAAFVHSKSVGSLAETLGNGTLYFVAGGGGNSGYGFNSSYGQNFITSGGHGGGDSGGEGSFSGNGTATPGKGGTQSAGGEAGVGGSSSYKAASGTYGAGGKGAHDEDIEPNWGGVGWVGGGNGGDGYYGGGGGGCKAATNSETGSTSAYGMGGGGGSGYVKAGYKTVSVISGTFTSSTDQGGGAPAGSPGSVKVTYAARTVLPVFFDKTQLERLFFNGTEAEHLVFNGVPVYMRRWAICLRSAAERFASRAGTRGSSPSAWRA